MKKWLLLLVASMMLVVAGCGDKDEDKEEEKPVEENEDENAEEEESDPAETDGIDQEIADEAFAVLEENNDYANAQDVDGYLKAVPADMQDETRQKIEETFAQGEIEIEILDYEYESANGNEVVISVLQTTVAKEDIPGFEDNISEITHTMQPEDGEWKIFNTEVVNLEPIGDEGEATDIDEDAVEEALNVLFDNVEYANDKDVDGYLKAIPEDEHKVAKRTIEKMFKEEDLELEILDYEVLSADENTVEIAVVQTTIAKEEVEGFEDNISEILHTLENMDGEWKIIASDILDMEPYEG